MFINNDRFEHACTPTHPQHTYLGLARVLGECLSDAIELHTGQHRLIKVPIRTTQTSACCSMMLKVCEGEVPHILESILGQEGQVGILCSKLEVLVEATESQRLLDWCE
jgi:hypothetical protein